MPSYAWTTTLTTPAALTGLVLTPDPTISAIVASVNASSDPNHDHYLWEAIDEDAAWQVVGTTTTPSFTWMLAPHNTERRMRVRDSNGTLSSDPVEASTTLEERHWWQVDLDGPDGEGADFIRELPAVLVGGTIDVLLDQTVLQPLSGPEGEIQPPIVITGQYQGERLSMDVLITFDQRALLRMLMRAARERRGKIAWKDPKGGVYLVAPGPQRRTDMSGGIDRVSVSAIRIA